MLVLTRKERESICIGADIKVTIIRFRGDAVRIGIDAPDNVPVHRKEVLDRILREKALADAKAEQEKSDG